MTAGLAGSGRWVATVGFSPGAAKIWDARDGALVKQLTEYGADYPRFSPDGRWLSTHADDGRLFAVLGFTIAGGKIVEIDILADPERLSRLDLSALDG